MIMSVYQGLLLVTVLYVVTAQDTTIYSPPVITTHPARETLFKVNGDQIRLDCAATGQPKPTVIWKKFDFNDNELPLMNDMRVTMQRNRLLINNPTARDEGLYQCIAKGRGTAMSNMGRVMRGYQASSNLPIMQDGSKLSIEKVFAAEPLKLDCNAPASYPNSTKTWFIFPNSQSPPQPPQAVTTSKRIVITEKGDLLFTYTTAKDSHDGHLDSGWHYMCSSYNPALRSSQFSSPVKVEVEGGKPIEPTMAPLKLQYRSESTIIAVKGKPFTINCVYAGKPAPTVVFNRPGEYIMPSKERLFNTDSSYGTQIGIKSATDEDAGLWTATINGDRKENFFVRVESEPVWTLEPVNMNVTQGAKSVPFHCQAGGKPEPTSQFYINAEKLTGSQAQYELNSDQGTLTFYNVRKPESVLVVQCKVQNKHGSSYRSGYLNVLEPLRLVEGPAASYTISETDKSKGTVMTCHVSCDPSDNVLYTWAKDGKPVNSLGLRGFHQFHSQGMSLLTISVNDLPEGESENDYIGEYTCLARTEYNNWTMNISKYYLQYTHGPDAINEMDVIIVEKSEVSDPRGAAMAGPWYIAVVVGAIILIIIIILIVCMVVRQGETYPVGKKERAAGHDPLKDDSGFHDYVRPSQEPTKGVESTPSSPNDSFYSDYDYKPAYDDGTDSVIGLDDIDPGKFNEDGSFIGAYGDEDKERDEQTQVQQAPYLYQQPEGVSVFI